MVNSAPLPPATVADLLDGYVSGALSPITVIDTAFDRIAQANPALNAMTALCDERARVEAFASQERYRRGTNRPLEGIPFAVKDLIDCAGLVTTYGSRLYADHVPITDAICVARLRQAGAILVGKTATHEFGWGITTTSALFGPTRNPLYLSRIPGGSSGGSAAAISAGLVPFALGTDTAGSIRIPSAFCGTVGLKPSRGRVPLDGVFPLASSLDHVGPMARSIADLQPVLAVMEGHSTPDIANFAMTSLRIGVVPAIASEPVALDIQEVFLDFLHRLTEAGANVATLAWPKGAPTDPFGILAPILNAEARRLHVAQLGHYPSHAADYSPDVAARIANAERYSLADYIAASQQRAHFTAAYSNLFAQADVVISPISSASPPELGAEMVSARNVRIELRQAVMGHIAPQSLTGLPACVFRIGHDNLGLPVGLQVTGPFGCDHKLLAIAATLEKAVVTAGK